MVRSIDEILKTSGLDATQIQNIHNGQLVNSSVASATNRDLGVKLAFLCKMSVDEARIFFIEDPQKKTFDDAVEDLHLIIDDGADSFAEVSFGDSPEEITKAYLGVSPGKTDLNLSMEEMKKFKDGTRESVEAILRDVLRERYQAYRKGGLTGVLPYTRKGSKNFDPGQELKEKLDSGHTLLKKECPAFYKCLIDYPNIRPDGLEESFFWTKSVMDEKPTFALVHHMGIMEGDTFICCERHFYVSRGHNSVQGIGGFFPVNESETVIVYLTRSSTDQVTGFGGSAKRAIGAKIMSGKVAANFEKLQKKVAEKNGK